MIPFRGGYYQLRRDTSLVFETNLYPVPDLEVPFLGVYVSPSIDGTFYIGPKAVPALGRENYHGLKGVEPLMALKYVGNLAKKAMADKKYVGI